MFDEIFLNMKGLYLITFCFIFLSVLSLSAQENIYFSAGYVFEKPQSLEPLKLAIDDFNTHQIEIKRMVSKEMTYPSLFRGFVFGLKMSKENFHSSVDIHFNKYVHLAKGMDSTAQYEYEKKIKLKHAGFTMQMGYHLIHAEKFRMGPALALAIEQYRFHTRSVAFSINTDYNLNVDQFMMAGDIRFPISFGGEKFNLDFIPFYHFPFWRVNATKFNEDLNFDYAKVYSKEQMSYRPVSSGLLITCNFKM